LAVISISTDVSKQKDVRYKSGNISETVQEKRLLLHSTNIK